ncbi:MAG: hypothetical protein DMG31_05990 [Acidobacteria bacterium]|nr:MAG: hypothetical protein DMG31_05990 [Acidobacteriota bacterium]
MIRFVERQKGVFAANVYQQDELRGVKEVITPFLPHGKVAAAFRRAAWLIKSGRRGGTKSGAIASFAMGSGKHNRPCTGGMPQASGAE